MYASDSKARLELPPGMLEPNWSLVISNTNTVFVAVLWACG